jgi:hypothetical protein
MEIDEYTLGLYLVVAVGVGIGLMAAFDWYRNNSPEILTRGKLREYGLPTDDKKISHIFNQKKKGRIKDAKKLLYGADDDNGDKGLQGLLDADSKKITKVLSKIDIIREDLNVVQDEIRGMDTEGEQRAFMKTHFTPHFADLRMEGERLGAAIASKTMIGQQMLFLEQVEQGHERKKVFETMEGRIFEDVDERMLIDDALAAFRNALDLDAGEARKTAKLWLELKS